MSLPSDSSSSFNRGRPSMTVSEAGIGPCGPACCMSCSRMWSNPPAVSSHSGCLKLIAHAQSSRSHPSSIGLQDPSAPSLRRQCWQTKYAADFSELQCPVASDSRVPQVPSGRSAPKGAAAQKDHYAAVLEHWRRAVPRNLRRS